MKNSIMKNSTIKNSTSNPSMIQTLQTQSQLLLPAITQALSVLQYREITHQRIAQQNSNKKCQIDAKILIVYQGLTRAQHPQLGYVMIKWQLNADNDSQAPSNLAHEADVLTSINTLSQNQNNPTAIAPPILAYESLIVQILEQFQQLTMVIMSYYPQGSLANQLSAKNHLSLTDKIKNHFIVQSAYLIANLHKAGWLHNDIKSSNILLDSFLTNDANSISVTPNLLLTDFSLAEPINKPMTANIAGTPAYLAPERWQGQSATVQSDIYAFGVMMTEILIGARPFSVSKQSSEPLTEWAIQHCQQPVPKLPLEYSRYRCIVDKTLAKRTAKRYQSMEEVLKDLTLLQNR